MPVYVIDGFPDRAAQFCRFGPVPDEFPLPAVADEVWLREEGTDGPYAVGECASVDEARRVVRVHLLWIA